MQNWVSLRRALLVHWIQWTAQSVYSSGWWGQKRIKTRKIMYVWKRDFPKNWMLRCCCFWINYQVSFLNELWPKHSPAKLLWQRHFNYNLLFHYTACPIFFTYLPLFNFLLKTQATAMTIPVLILTIGTHSMECTEQSVENTSHGV